MLFRYARTADGVALEAAGLEQACGVIARRIAEHRTGIGQGQRLFADALMQQFFDAATRGLAITARETEPGGGKPFVHAEIATSQFDMAVTDIEIPGRAFAQGAAAREHEH